MKICMLAFDFLPNPGGVAAHVYELSKILNKRDNNVDVITINKWNKAVFYNHKIDGINVYSFRSPFHKIFSNKINNLILLPIITFFLILRLNKYDIFHFHGLFSLDYYILKILKKYQILKLYGQITLRVI